MANSQADPTGLKGQAGQAGRPGDAGRPGVAGRPDATGQAGADQPRWVLHEHDRPRHHFDLRLEFDGVLVSWAVPKGMPEDPDHNRLAVHVQDHAIEHLGYVDEQKRIADTGTFTMVKRTDREISVVLHGQTGSAAYALIHTGEQNWLLHKLKRQPA